MSETYISHNPILKYSQPIPHGFLLSGDKNSAVSIVRDFLTKRGRLMGDPNVHYLDHVTLTVDHVRSLSDLVSMTSVGNTTSYYVISFERITLESQNALLKTLEEPPYGVTIFLCTGGTSGIKDTIFSRVQHISCVTSKSDYDINCFIESDYLQRINMLRDLVGDSKKNIPPNRYETMRFLTELLRNLHEQKNFTVYNDIEYIQRYCNDSSSSIKYIIEYVSSTVPRG